MKKLLPAALCLLLCLALAGCGEDSAASKPVPPPASPEVVQPQAPTVEAVTAAFLSHQENQSREVTDCVVASDGAYGLTGVVQYTDTDGNPACLAFLKGDFFYPLGLDAENTLRTAEDSAMTYAGDGTVTLSLLDPETGTVYDYTASYAYDESENATEFVVRSSPRS